MLETAAGMPEPPGRQSDRSARWLQVAERSGLPLAHARGRRGRAPLQQRRIFPPGRPRPSRRATSGARPGTGAFWCRPRAGNVLAYAQRADGSVQVFLRPGARCTTTGAAASALLQRLADGAGAATGWRLTTANSDVETYDAAGRLLSVALRARAGAHIGLHGEWPACHGHRFVRQHADLHARRVGPPRAASWRRAIAFTPTATMRGPLRLGHLSGQRGADLSLRERRIPARADRDHRRERKPLRDMGIRRIGFRAISAQHAGGADAVTLYTHWALLDPDRRTEVCRRRVRDPVGTITTRSSGGVARVRQVTDAAGSLVSTFDANGNLATRRDRNGNQTTYAHDLARNLEISRTEAGAPRLPARSRPSGIRCTGCRRGSSRLPVCRRRRGNGLHLRRTGQSAAQGHFREWPTRQWDMTYNAIGRVLTVDGPRTDVTDVTTYTYYGATDPCVGCRGNREDGDQRGGSRDHVQRIRRRRPADPPHRPQRRGDDADP